MSTAIKLLPLLALVITTGAAFWLWADRRAWIKISDEAHEIIMSMSGAGQRAQAAEQRAEAALATITELKRQLADAERRARRRGRTRGTATPMPPIAADPSVPPGELHFRQDGRTVGVITGISDV